MLQIHMGLLLLSMYLIRCDDFEDTYSVVQKIKLNKNSMQLNQYNLLSLTERFTQKYLKQLYKQAVNNNA